MLIEDRKPKGSTKDSGYYRLIRDLKFADLLRKIQSCVIGNGNELEKLIYKNVRSENKFYNRELSNFKLETVNDFVVQMKVPVPICFGLAKKNIALDNVVFTPTDIYVIEIKDGFNFDTKKSQGEVKSLMAACDIIEKADPLNRKCISKIVFWSANSLQQVSFKAKGSEDMWITGKDYSSKFNIDYNKVEAERMEDAEKNLTFLVEKLIDIILQNPLWSKMMTEALEAKSKV
jgi:hypothetical protein